MHQSHVIDCICTRCMIVCNDVNMTADSAFDGKVQGSAADSVGASCGFGHKQWTQTVVSQLGLLTNPGA